MNRNLQVLRNYSRELQKMTLSELKILINKSYNIKYDSTATREELIDLILNQELQNSLK